MSPARGKIATSTTCFSPDIRARRPRPDRLLRCESRHLGCQGLAGSAARTHLGALVPNWLLNCAVGGPRVVDGGQMLRGRLPNFVNRNETLPRARRDLEAACDQKLGMVLVCVLRYGSARPPPPRLARFTLEVYSTDSAYLLSHPLKSSPRHLSGMSALRAQPPPGAACAEAPSGRALWRLVWGRFRRRGFCWAVERGELCERPGRVSQSGVLGVSGEGSGEGSSRELSRSFGP